jgi:hypothetical protein
MKEKRQLKDFSVRFCVTLCTGMLLIYACLRVYRSAKKQDAEGFFRLCLDSDALEELVAHAPTSISKVVLYCSLG